MNVEKENDKWHNRPQHRWTIWDNEVGTPETSKTLQINADGTWTPATGISINAGGEAKFDVDYPTGMTVCNIAISVTFSASVDDGTGGTVKIGS